MAFDNSDDEFDDVDDLEHVRAALREGGFPRIVWAPVVALAAADGRPWRHARDAHRLRLALRH
jgi:hypothetical protein